MAGNSLKTDVRILRWDEHEVGVAPAMGAITFWRWRDADIFRPSDPAAIAARDPLGVACFAMAPWVSRVRDSRFDFHGRTFALNPETDPRLGRFAIHGEVWRNPWTITQQSDLRLDLACAPGRDGAWPWDYVCTQSIVIAENGLEMTLSLQSNSDAPFPYTFGLHPYFARRGENRLSARVQHRAILSPEGMPLGEEDGSARWRDETVTRGVEDHCYRGWTGEAVVAFIDDRFQVRMRAEGCDFLQVYAPDADYFCVEPQTGGPNALNRGLDGGVRILEPRGRATIFVCFTPEAF